MINESPIKINNCPSCDSHGTPLLFFTGWYILCSNHSCAMKTQCFHKQEDAIHAWNGEEFCKLNKLRLRLHDKPFKIFCYLLENGGYCVNISQVTFSKRLDLELWAFKNSLSELLWKGMVRIKKGKYNSYYLTKKGVRWYEENFGNNSSTSVKNDLKEKAN